MKRVLCMLWITLALLGLCGGALADRYETVIVGSPATDTPAPSPVAEEPSAAPEEAYDTGIVGPTPTPSPSPTPSPKPTPTAPATASPTPEAGDDDPGVVPDGNGGFEMPILRADGTWEEFVPEPVAPTAAASAAPASASAVPAATVSPSASPTRESAAPALTAQPPAGGVNVGLIVGVGAGAIIVAIVIVAAVRRKRKT